MFLKFGKKEHIEDLYANGTIYLNPIQYFREIEDNELRGDHYEGITRIKNYPPGQFEIPELNIKGEYLALQIRESYESVLGNIFSLYCVSSFGWNNPATFKIDQKIKKFGSHCLIVKDNVKFLKLIEEKLKALKYNYRHNFIKYYDKDKVDREITLFEKPLEFEYQKEFRFYVDSFSDKPLTISIGCLSGIAEIHSTEKIVDGLELKVELNEAK